MQPSLQTVKPSSKDRLSVEEKLPFEKCISDTKLEVIITNVMPGVLYIDNVLTEEECSNLCSCVDSSPSLSFWNLKGRDLNKTQFRNVDTIELDSNDIASKLWNRIKELDLVKKVIISEFLDSEYDTGTEGTWVACGLNEHLLFGRYPSGGSFSPHTDGCAVKDFNCRSLFSVIVFLNTVPSGGGTIFYKDGSTNYLSLIENDKKFENRWSLSEDYLEAKVLSKVGRMVVFQQSKVHEGEPPAFPHMKYIIRSDIMFRRESPICDSETDREAFKLYQRGEELAEEGFVNESINCFKMAFRMSPSLKIATGNG